MDIVPIRTKREIRARFGDRVAKIVEGCTDTFDDPKPEWTKRKQEYIAHLRDEADTATCLVSAADKLHNARAILHGAQQPTCMNSRWLTL